MHLLFSYVFNLNVFLQLLAVVASFGIPCFLLRLLEHFMIEHPLVRSRPGWVKGVISVFIYCIAWFFLLVILVVFSRKFEWDDYLMITVFALLWVWVLAWFGKERILTVGVAIAAVLHIVGLRESADAWIEQMSFQIDGRTIPLLKLLEGTLVLLTLLLVAKFVIAHLEQRINRDSDLEPRGKVLLAKLLRVFSIGCSIVIGFSVMGIDISALTVFGGAIGLGLGFGLQKVISNLICGVILLLDRSIKPGDVIAIQGSTTYGIVNKLSARFVAIRTPSGQEHLIPNEEIITNSVENWSYSDRDISLTIPVRVSLDTDVRRAMQVMLTAAQSVRRVLLDPKPSVRMYGIGEYALDLELSVWINDPENGLGGVRSDLYLAIWDAFRRENIHVPLPQREVRLTNAGAEASVLG